MNSINLTGNICNDLELKQTTSGKSVLNVNLAVKRPYSKDTTDFIPIVLYEQNAEYISRYAHKGSKVAITGKLTTRSYTDNGGQKRTVFEVLADVAEICEPAANNATQTKSAPVAQGYTPTAYTGNAQGFEELPDQDGLPF